MKESVGYTLTLNIAITFIIIVFAFLSAAIIYFKSNKIGNSVVNSIEKYEGYNSQAINEINIHFVGLGYSRSKINCANVPSGCENKTVDDAGLVTDASENGYCVYYCSVGDYYYYRVKSNMSINIPILNELFTIPVYSNTNEMYDFRNLN